MTAEQVEHALKLFEQIRFSNPPRSQSTDGSDWIFESKVNDQYRLVDFRNVPSQEARDFGLYLVLDLAKVNIPKGAIY